MKKNTFNINNLIRANVARMKPYSSARDEYKADGREMTFLDANENPYENGVNRYPDPQQGNLKTRLANLKGVTESSILLGNGSDEILDLLFRGFCEPKRDNIITLPPTYGMYKVLAELNEVKDKEVVLKADFQPNVSKIIEEIDEYTKMIFLCSPNNPTGNSFSDNLILQLLNHFNGLVVLDEAYIEFSKQEGWLSRIHDFPNLVITQTLSKACGMAGIRLGICYASEEIINVLNKIKPPYNVNQLTQNKALERLSRPENIQTEVSNILKQREFLAEELRKLSIVEKVYPSDANFILARVDNADLRYQQLLQRGIVVRNRSSQPLCENTIRFTVGTEKENERLITALRIIDKEK